jgi:uncharacterized surface protein with fasciclin (FAS1) repeats
MQTIKKISSIIALFISVVTISSCNKELEQVNEAAVVPSTLPKLDQSLRDNADFSLYYALVVRGNQLSLINDSTRSFTMFVPGNAGIKALINALSGGLIPTNAPNAVFEAFINNQVPVEQAAAIVQYNTIPQVIRASSIPNTYFNFSYPSTLNPLPSVSPLLRLNVFPSGINGAWLNNVPIFAFDREASNGVIHQTATLAIPAQRTLWDRISTDTTLKYLKAAVQRADSGVAPVSSSSLVWVLSNFGPDITVFAPVDTAFQKTLKFVIYQALVAQDTLPQTALQMATVLSSTPNVFSNPLLYGVLSKKTVKGILAYHILGKRAYTNNMPTTATAFPTLLNTDTAYRNHPGVRLKVNNNPPNPFIVSGTIKDVNPNTSDANIIINASPLTPEPFGTSDQEYINGVLHKIDAVLLPQ